MTKQMPSVLRRLLISSVLAVALAMSGPNLASDSKPFAADTSMVLVPRAELRELYAGVDSLLLERRLLMIDLNEIRRWSRVDSTLNAERLALLQKDKDSWLVRGMKHPIMDAVYFCLGVYVGVQIVNYAR